MKIYHLTYRTESGTFSLWSLTPTQAEMWRQTLIRKGITEWTKTTVHNVGRNKAAITQLLNEYATGARHTV